MLSRCLFLSLSSRSIKFVLSENSSESVVFEFYLSALPVFLFIQSVFFSFVFTLLFPALYNDLCVKTTLNSVTLVFQETKDKTKMTACIVVL